LAIAVKKHRAFRPDIVVLCPGASPNEQTTSTPLIPVEVLSPSSAPIDRGLKLEIYFSLASLTHSLIVDPDRRALTHLGESRTGPSSRSSAARARCDSIRPESTSNLTICSGRRIEASGENRRPWDGRPQTTVWIVLATSSVNIV
jgi:hypothetical protein